MSKVPVKYLGPFPKTIEVVQARAKRRAKAANDAAYSKPPRFTYPPNKWAVAR